MTLKSLRLKAKALGIIHWKTMSLDDLVWWVRTHEAANQQKRAGADMVEN